MISGPFPHELEELVSSEMASGGYASPHEVLLAGVQLLHQKRLAHEQLKADIQHAIDQADRGEYLEFDQAGLRQFFDELKAKALKAGEKSAAP